VFVLHDLDVAGFSIFGTLARNGRRYTHMNEVPLINIGLRLIDVAVMDLQGERVTVPDRYARAATLRRHGATDQEIEFLSRRRVELNAMTSRQLSCRSSCCRRRRSRRTTRRSAARRAGLVVGGVGCGIFQFIGFFPTPVRDGFVIDADLFGDLSV
jgi:hypothetical protein